MYYNARYYDPDLGRFLQADTVSDGMNRYAYCGNNPVRYVDSRGNTHTQEYYEAYEKMAKKEQAKERYKSNSNDGHDDNDSSNQQ